MPELPEGARIVNYQFSNGWHRADVFTSLPAVDDLKDLFQALGRTKRLRPDGTYLHYNLAEQQDDLLFVRVTSRRSMAFRQLLQQLGAIGFCVGSDLRGTSP